MKKLRDGVSNGANALQRLRDPKGVENTQELWLTLAIIEEFVLRHGPTHFVTNCAVRHGGIVEKQMPARSPEDSLWFSCIVHVEHHFMVAEISRAAVCDAGAGAGAGPGDGRAGDAAIQLAVHVYDSLRGSYNAQLDKWVDELVVNLRKWFPTIAPHKPKVEYKVSCDRQTNTYDCGVYATKFACGSNWAALWKLSET